MRLTLRTLLAYLDDVLPPEQTKELGQKLAESNYATALVDRIKEVMRRRRLTAPELTGPALGIEPNVVAQYLDNELAPNEIADVEKICLDSDVHLAEVAACHQILTLVLGEPVDVRSETRARMYALGPDTAERAATITSLEMARHRPNHEFSMPLTASGLGTPAAVALDRTLPEYLRPKKSWKNVGLWALLLLIAVVWLGLVMRDPTIIGGVMSSKRPNVTPLPFVAENQAGSGDLSARSLDATPPPGQGAGVAVVSSRNPLNQPHLVASDNTAGREDSPAANSLEQPSAPAKQPSNNDNSELPLNANVGVAKVDKNGNPPPDNIEPKPAGTNFAPTTDPAAPPKPAPLSAPLKMLYVWKNEGVLLHWDEMVSDYLVLPRRSDVKPGDVLACPEPFRSDIVVGDDRCLVALIGGTAVRCLGPTEQGSFGFDIQQGAVLFEAKGLTPPADADKVEPEKPATLPIAIGLRGQVHRLELTSDDALCGIEVHRRAPIRFETGPAAPGFTAAVFVARGTVRFQFADGPVKTMTGPGFIAVTPDATPKEKESDLGRPPRLDLPDWLESDPKRAAAKTPRLYNTAFEREFDPEQPLLLSLPTVVSNKRPAISELAVKCLALTDNCQWLVKALIQTEHREARLAAINGLRQWLPLDAKHGEQLRTELAKLLMPSEKDVIYRLLWGFSPDDAKLPTASRLLVGWLDHEHVAVRELAFFHIQSLTKGLKLDYSPVNPPAQRRAAVERWYSHLDKRGGKLVQE